MLVGAVVDDDERVIAEADVAIVQSLGRYAGPGLLLERLIDDITADGKCFVQRRVRAVLPALVSSLVVEVVIDHDPIARHWRSSSDAPMLQDTTGCAEHMAATIAPTRAVRGGRANLLSSIRVQGAPHAKPTRRPKQIRASQGAPTHEKAAAHSRGRRGGTVQPGAPRRRLPEQADHPC